MLIGQTCFKSMLRKEFRSLPIRTALSPISSLSYPGSPGDTYDAIIIGAGHNGLVAAGYLQKAGINVCVLERRPVIGGAAVTEEIVPGFKFSRASYLLSLLRPSIIRDLELKEHGLKLYMRDPSSYTPLAASHWKPGGARSLTLSSDAEFNKREIAKFSAKDAEAFHGYEKWLSRLVAAIDPLIDAKPIDLSSSGSLVDRFREARLLTKSMRRLRGELGSFYDIMTAPAKKILDHYFESEPLKATLATDAVIGAMMGPNSLGSGYVLLHHVMGEIEGRQGAWAYPEGGMGGVTSAMAKSAIASGARIFTDQNVEQVLVDDGGHAEGVRLSTGHMIRSQMILSNATPHVTFLNLLPAGSLPRAYENKIRAIDYTSPVTKINVALRELPNFVADPHTNPSNPSPHHRCTIHINCEETEMLDRAFQQGLQGLIPDRPMVELTIPSSLDPTLAPSGCHVALLFTQYTPFELQSGPWDEASKEAYANRVFQQIDEYAPGFQKSVIGYEVLTPPDLERIFGLTGGNIFHGAIQLDQLYFTRPISPSDGLPQFPATPVRGLFICGSGCHPGGGVMGVPGRLAAEEAIRRAKRRKF